MTITVPNSDRRRTTLLHVASAIWFLIVSAALVTGHVALWNLTEQTESRAPVDQVTALEGRVTDLAQQVELQHQQQPVAVPQARYDADRQALEQHLAEIKQALGERLTTDSLQALQARVAQLETRSAQRQIPAVTVRPRAADPVPSKPTEPSFQVVGVELRAGERFVSILPTGATALAQVRLLRVGEEEAGWRLETIDGTSAVFRQAGETRRVSIPPR
ncbi:hypothetical protein [Verminephrobacter eiseniae]|uniref:hypothetical protein n=1 Tax=Verminephrobacter eiseniae TaxID=364317 RepID=UPI0022385D10|nr:hypothetical protein [Verminephrobacter eiseniae]MCW5233399.1 hypothetical protein [Verminephrobacter eiseniae]MCW5295048.1 hypothetical protein [Verminephrobacter eiseniae]MCW8186059.1 hypothetical protein [Verminephrobacter eiseniae]MCW8224903.1 hypothetical protein [Verminephrobacter eiseniae]MCW8235953.1 hypothetical protein [Verminephrobacter eiseniae]